MNDGIENAAYKSARRFGVSEFTDLKDLLPTQESILQRVLTQILEIAQKETDARQIAGNSVDYLDDIRKREPVFTFLIDGVRGSGKTSLAKTIRAFLERYNADQVSNGSADEIWGKIFAKHEDFKTPRPLQVKDGRQVSTHCLPLIKPDDMDVSETIMEAIFSCMLGRIDARIHELGQREKRSESDDRELDRGRKLRENLNTRVAKGWYFSRRLGVEALMNDSMSFDDYIDRRATEAKASHERIEAWREFVVSYLDYFDAAVLGIFVDDTDISRHLTVDLLHSIRLFFCHPRIVSVVAANLHATRQKLLSSTLSEMSDAFRTLRKKDSYTAIFWREFERDNLEEYLAKVFPRQRRNFIKLDEEDFGTLLRIGGEDQEKPRSFIGFCTGEMKKRLKSFLLDLDWTYGQPNGEEGGVKDSDDAVVKDANSWISNHPDTGAIGEDGEKKEDQNVVKNATEDYLALWLIRNHYARDLMPRSARHMNQFADMISDRKSQRRVVVATISEPVNHQIIQRLTDHDGNLMTWINAQNIVGKWRGSRAIQINALELTQNSRAYAYILFRLDLEISKPHLASKSINFPMTLLPVPSGKKVWTPEVWRHQGDRARINEVFFERDRSKGDPEYIRFRQELHGLAQTFTNPIIPANCLYFKDLRALPDLAWEWEEDQKDGRRTFGQFPVRYVDIIFDIDPPDRRADYFRKIVLLYASFPLMPPIPPDEFHKDSSMLVDLELASFGVRAGKRGGEAAGEELFPETLKGRHYYKHWIDEGAQLLSYPIRRASLGRTRPRLTLPVGSFKDFRRFELAKIASSKGIRYKEQKDLKDEARLNDQLRKKRKNPKSKELSGHPYLLADDVVSIVPRYVRILDDVRRSYHALRIMEGELNDYTFADRTEAITSGGKGASGNDERLSGKLFEHSRNDRYRLLSVRRLRAILGLGVGVADDHRAAEDDTRSVPLFYRRYCGGVPEDEITRTWGFDVDLSGKNGESKICITIPERGGQSSKEIFSIRINDHQSSKPRAELSSEFLGFDYEKSIRSARKMFHDAKSEISDSFFLTMFDSRDANHSRRVWLLRSRLFFLWGAGPCLSSLIHLGVMGTLYGDLRNSGDDEDQPPSDKPDGPKTFETAKKEALDVLAGWEQTLILADILIFLFAQAFRVNLRRDIMTAKGFSSDKRSAFRPIPDFSPDKLGIDLELGKEDKEREREKAEIGGIFGDTMKHINLALIYIDILRGRLESAAEIKSEKPAAKNKR